MLFFFEYQSIANNKSITDKIIKVFKILFDLDFDFLFDIFIQFLEKTSETIYFYNFNKIVDENIMILFIPINTFF